MDRAVVIARSEHPLATRRSVSAADLARYPWVLARRWELERKALDELFAGQPGRAAAYELDRLLNGRKRRREPSEA